MNEQKKINKDDENSKKKSKIHLHTREKFVHETMTNDEVNNRSKELQNSFELSRETEISSIA